MTPPSLCIGQKRCSVAYLLAQRGLDAAPRVFFDRRTTTATGTDQASIDKALGKAPSCGLTRYGVEGAILAHSLIRIRRRDLVTNDLTFEERRRDAVVGTVPNQIVERRAEKLDDADRWTVAH